MNTTVVKIRKNTYDDTYDAFIGRPSIFGNPFHVGKDGTRTEVVFKHFMYFRKRLTSDPEFKRTVLALRGKKLGCFCHDWDGTGENPMYCHGDNIADYLNSLPE